MIEIIPNWHPVFVHFTVALLSLTVVFHIAHAFVSQSMLKQQLQILANWNLYLGTAFGIVTATAGWIAYNTVAHDAPSHEAMTEHRNLALVTLGLFILLTAWSAWQKRQERSPGKLFLIVLLIGGGLLTSTAWHGAEAVYRYGLGVMSLPQAEGDGHAHKHGNADAHASENEPVKAQTQTQSDTNTHSSHQHDHGTSGVDNTELELQPDSEMDDSMQSPETQDTDSHSGHSH